MRRYLVAAAISVALVLVMLAGNAATTTPAAYHDASVREDLLDAPVAPAARARPAVLVGAGDIAGCASAGDEATAALLDGIDGIVFTTGDNVYDSGTADEFARCYGPSWGRHWSRTRPAAGNHDHGTPGAAAYRAYFGGAPYYSYDAGAWHVVVLDSDCWAVGGCGRGSAQERWLREELARSGARCTLAYWHHPLYTSGLRGGNAFVQDLYTALYEAGADLVIWGHDHFYEQFAPADAAGRRDDAGMRAFIVGTGGRSLYPIGPRHPLSEVARNDSFGVLKLTLDEDAYAWEFIGTSGAVLDAGEARCR